jgi:heme o synthase
MNSVSSVSMTPRSRWRHYYELCKPRVVMLMVFTAFVGMLLAQPGAVPWDIVVWANLGIALVAGGAAAVNHWADQRIDAIMARTRGRPLPTGQLSSREVLGFALALSVLGTLVLFWRVNALTAALSLLSLVGYAGVYTLYLKRATPQNIVIGGAAGAAPPLLGWTAVTNAVSPDALLLFLIIFVWTPPHFWALAVARQREYAKADIPMLPVTHGADFTRWHIVLYTLMLTAVSVLPFATQMVGLGYLLGALALDALFLYYAVRLYRTQDDKLAMRTFSYSIVYLGALFGLMLLDRYSVIWFR